MTDIPEVSHISTLAWGLIVLTTVLLGVGAVVSTIASAIVWDERVYAKDKKIPTAKSVKLMAAAAGFLLLSISGYFISAHLDEDTANQRQQAVQQVVSGIEEDTGARIVDVGVLEYEAFLDQESFIQVHFEYDSTFYEGRLHVLDGGVRLLIPVSYEDSGFVPFDAAGLED